MADDVSASSYASVSGQSAQMGPKMDVNLPDKVYFEFDNFDLGDDAMDTLEQYIRFAKRAKAIRLEGHCDRRKSTRLNSSHITISYAVFCLKKKNKKT